MQCRKRLHSCLSYVGTSGGIGLTRKKAWTQTQLHGFFGGLESLYCCSISTLTWVNVLNISFTIGNGHKSVESVKTTALYYGTGINKHLGWSQEDRSKYISSQLAGECISTCVSIRFHFLALYTDQLYSFKCKKNEWQHQRCSVNVLF